MASISGKRLNRWRAEALEHLRRTQYLVTVHGQTCGELVQNFVDSQRRIDKLTRELIDRRLLERLGRR